MGNKRPPKPFCRVHHIGIVTRDMEKTVEKLDAYGISRAQYPTLPAWLEKRLFKDKTFDKTYKFLWFGPYVHPMTFKIIDVDHSWDEEKLAAIGLPPMKMEGGGGEKPKVKYRIYKAWAGNIIFEICQPVEGDQVWQRELDKKGEGLQHIGLEVNSYDMVERLIENGAKKLAGGIVDNGTGDFGYYLDLGFGFPADVFKGYY